METTPPPFGRLLRFWRNTFGLSQEALSLDVGVSARHISFLETGRSRPGQALVHQLAEAFKLSDRDASNLLAAAGYFPRTPGNLSGPEQRWLRKAASLRLRDLEPAPAWVADPCGNILLVNRGWVSLTSGLQNDAQAPLRTNAYHLYFSDQGLRRHLLDWEDLACALLVNLQQEVLMTEDGAAQEILAELLDYPGVPADWARRGARVPYSHSFKVRLQQADGSLYTFIAVNNTLGATPYVARPRLIVSALHPLDKGQWRSFQPDPGLAHPLLYGS